MSVGRWLVSGAVVFEAALCYWLWPSVWAVPIIVMTELIGLGMTLPDQFAIDEDSEAENGLGVSDSDALRRTAEPDDASISSSCRCP